MLFTYGASLFEHPFGVRTAAGRAFKSCGHGSSKNLELPSNSVKTAV